MAARRKFNSGRINYLIKNNFTNTSTSTSITENPILRTIIETPILTSLTPQPISLIQPILSIQPTLSSQGFGKELTNLIKMYIKDNKYNGEDDNFNFKLTIFYDLYSRANVP